MMFISYIPANVKVVSQRMLIYGMYVFTDASNSVTSL